METKELKELYKDGFDDSKEFIDYFFSNCITEDNVLLKKENGKIISAGYVIEKPAFFLGRKTLLPYFSALSTLKDYRGKGHIASIIDEGFKKLYDRGYAFCVLHPFNREYYKRYSFADINSYSESVIDGGTRFKSRLAGEDDYSAIIDIYEEYISSIGFDNYLKLNPHNLCLKFSEFASDGIVCTILSAHEDFAFAFCDKNRILFYAAKDMKLFNSAENFKGLIYEDFTKTDKHYLQGRIINVKKMLQTYPYKKDLDLSVKLRIIDAQIKDNNIITQLNIKNGVAALQPCKTSDFVFTVGELCQKMFDGGSPLFTRQKSFFADKY